MNLNLNKIYKGLPTIKELTREREKRNKERFLVCQRYMELFSEKINLANKQGFNQCRLDIPLISTQTMYRPDFCLKYTLNELKKKKYKVVFHRPNILYVSWPAIDPFAVDNTNHDTEGITYSIETRNIKNINISDLAEKYKNTSPQIRKRKSTKK